MHPIIPTIMSLGTLSFLVGIFIQAWLGAKKIKTIRLFGKEYKLWQFVLISVGSGITLIMISVHLPKYLPYEPEPDPHAQQPAISSNLKFELQSLLSKIDANNDTLMPAINRFQREYQTAMQKGDKNTMDLLILEMAFIIRTELKKQNHPENEVEREVERIMGFLKQKPE
ncbi:MAG: hypothetical protein AABY47_01720 [Pseudomonadota bacterium]